jgi:hypothetical protein
MISSYIYLPKNRPFSSFIDICQIVSFGSSSIQAPSPCAHRPRRSRVSWPRWKVPVPLRSRWGIVVESWLVNEYVDTNQVNLGDIWEWGKTNSTPGEHQNSW